MWLCILGMIGLWTWMRYSKVGYRQPISSFLSSLRTDFSFDTDSVSCQWRVSHGPWGTSRLLVVDSLLRTMIEYCIINFWTKKKNPDNHQSTSGFAFDVGGGVILWSSKKQPTVVTSSVEVEYIVSANATKEAIWLWTLLKELDLPQTKVTIIHADNQGSIALAHNLVSYSRAKHIDIWHHFIWECIGCGEISLEYVSIKKMIADIFIKTLPHGSFENFQTSLSILCTTG